MEKNASFIFGERVSVTPPSPKFESHNTCFPLHWFITDSFLIKYYTNLGQNSQYIFLGSSPLLEIQYSPD